MIDDRKYFMVGGRELPFAKEPSSVLVGIWLNDQTFSDRRDLSTIDFNQVLEALKEGASVTIRPMARHPFYRF